MWFPVISQCDIAVTLCCDLYVISHFSPIPIWLRHDLVTKFPSPNVTIACDPLRWSKILSHIVTCMWYTAISFRSQITMWLVCDPLRWNKTLSHIVTSMWYSAISPRSPIIMWLVCDLLRHVTNICGEPQTCLLNFITPISHCATECSIVQTCSASVYGAEGTRFVSCEGNPSFVHWWQTDVISWCHLLSVRP